MGIGKSKMVLVFVIYCSVQSFAQKNTLSSGGNGNGNGGSISFSVGQIDYIVANGSGGNASQGIQQAYEIYTTFGEELKNFQITYLIYPNPTTSGLNISIIDSNKPDYNYTLTSSDGKIIKTDALKEENTFVSMAELDPGVYIFSIQTNQKVFKTYRIIKN